MTSPAIRVENLSKQYQIGARENGYTTFREALSGFVTNPFRRFKSLSGSANHDESFWALKDVSFDVQSGEVVGIIGRNGAGKSTLLKILSQITEPTEGRVEINGRVASLLEVGTGFHPELTGRENIFLNGAILGMSRTEVRRKFDEIVAFAEVEKFLDTPVKRYSSGMYVRLAFAVAANMDPEILVIDEVLAVGDPQFQKKCLGKMDQVAKGGRTVLFVSHNLGAVSSLCSVGIVLKDGERMFHGPVGDAIRLYNGTASANSAPIYTAPRVQSKPYIKQVSMEQKGACGQEFTADLPMTISLTVDRKNYNDAACTVLIRNAAGVCVFHGTDEFSPDFGSYALRSSRRCIAPAFALNSDSYFLTVALGSRSTNQLFDKLDDIIAFTVNFDGTCSGRAIGANWRGCCGPGLYSWE